MVFQKRTEIIAEILDYIRKNDICYFNQIVDYAAKNKFDTWFPVLTDDVGARLFGDYFEAMQEERKEKRELGSENNAK